MKKILLSILFVSFLSANASAQWGGTPGPFPGPAGGTTIVFDTVANLPGSPSANDLAGVTDGADEADCTVGTGTDQNICVYSGSAWVIIGDGQAVPASGDSVTVNSVAIDTTANFLDNIYADYILTDGGAGGPDDITSKPDYSQTLAGNPALLVDECTFMKDASGGGFICEGDTADTNEFLARMPNVNPADSTYHLLLTSSAIAPTAISAFLDEDTMGSDSATAIASQQSIKAYVDNTNRNDFWNGAFVESFDALATSDGGTITMSLEQSGGGDLTAQFSSGNTTIDCTPACTIALTAGTDTAPQSNYIYILQSAPSTLVKSTSAWPTVEHIKVSYFFVQSATFLNTANRGALINQNWNDHLANTNNMGHMVHIAEVARIGTGYFSGIDGNGSDTFIDITTNVGTPDNVYIKTTSGFSYQMHKHTVPAKDTSGTDVIHVVNHNTTPYTDISDLATQLTDASGGSMSGKYFNIIFGIIANKTGEYTPLVMNLPTGSYSNLSNAINDVDNYDVVSGPREFLKESTTGIFVARVTFKHSAASGGTWTVENTSDLRSAIIGGGGSISSALTEFADNQFMVFDEADITKILAFDVGALVTTGNTRTWTIGDLDLTFNQSVAIGAGPAFTSPNITTAIDDANGNEMIAFSAIGSALNHIQIQNAATGNSPEISAVGDEANLALIFQAKGNEDYKFKGTSTASAELRLYEDTDNGTNYQGIAIPAAITTSRVFNFPDDQMADLDFIVATGAGTFGYVPITGDITIANTGIATIGADKVGTAELDETVAYTWSGASLISGVHEVQDDIDFNFGNDADWSIQYDEAVDNQLLFETTNTSAVATTDPMVEFLVGTTPTADQQVFGVAKGTQATNTPLFTIDEDGDAIIAGKVDIGSGASSIEFNGATSADPCGTGTTALDTGALFFSSGGFFCYCDDTATSVDLKLVDDGACTY